MSLRSLDLNFMEIVMSTRHSEIKLTIAKLIEVAYSKNKGLTTSIMLDAGFIKLTAGKNHEHAHV